MNRVVEKKVIEDSLPIVFHMILANYGVSILWQETPKKGLKWIIAKWNEYFTRVELNIF